MNSSSNTENRPFPALPIVTPDPPGRSEAEKYGLLYWVGIVGLAIVLLLVGWFGYRAWALRDVWANVYLLHDATRTEDERIQAAYALSRDPRVEQRQLWEMSLRLGLPDLARYLLAEGVGPELVAQDPQSYASAVARSPDWPPWLRLALAMPLASAASQGHTLSRERLAELTRLGDPVLRLWALYALALQPRPDPQTMIEIERVSKEPSEVQELARILLKTIRSGEGGRAAGLAEASDWSREHHPDTRKVWQGWRIEQGRLIRAGGDGPDPGPVRQAADPANAAGRVATS